MHRMRFVAEKNLKATEDGHKVCPDCGRVMICPEPSLWGKGATEPHPRHAWCEHFATENSPKKVYIPAVYDGNHEHACDETLKPEKR